MSELAVQLGRLAWDLGVEETDVVYAAIQRIDALEAVLRETLRCNACQTCAALVHEALGDTS